MSDPAITDQPTITTTSLTPRVGRAVPRGLPLAPPPPPPPAALEGSTASSVSSRSIDSGRGENGHEPPEPPARRRRRDPARELVEPVAPDAEAFTRALQQEIERGLAPAFEAMRVPTQPTLSALVEHIRDLVARHDDLVAALAKRSAELAELRKVGCVPASPNTLDALNFVVHTITPLSTDARQRVLSAAGVLCGSSP